MEDAVLARWREEAEVLRQRVVTHDTLPGLAGVRLVGGMDLSFVPGDALAAVACLVVCALPSCEVVYEECRAVTLTAPYLPGYLAFREADHLVALLETLRERQPELLPQVLVVDGNGILHQQGCGLACHVGVRTGEKFENRNPVLISLQGFARLELQRRFCKWTDLTLRRSKPIFSISAKKRARGCRLWGRAARGWARRWRRLRG
jgi:hypothetical protein